MRKEIDLKILEYLFLVERKNVSEIAKEMALDWATVKKHLVKLGIYKRRPQLRDKYGRFIMPHQVLPDNEFENHPNFKNGSRCYRKRAAIYHIKECFHCGRKDGLQVHHLDRNRENNNWWNLRWVCTSCHSNKEHFDKMLNRDEKGRFKKMR